MKALWFGFAIGFSVLAATSRADSLSFSTFVPQSSIAATEGGNTSTIAFNYAGNKFVGSVFSGVDNNQLFSTNLSGGNLQQFGAPIAGAAGEVVMGVSLGQGGFAAGEVYAGSSVSGQIWRFNNSGSSQALFATLPNSDVIRQIFFDPGSSFSGNMLVTTTSGRIYRVTSGGSISTLVDVGEDVEGLDIATSAWGPYTGYLLTGSEGSGAVRLISPTGTVTVVGTVAGAETVSFVPLTLDPSNPLEGFYVANYPSNIQFAAASVFTTQGLQGDAIVTNEFGGSSAFDVHYNSGPGTFSINPFSFTGNPISQFEDGIFVTPQRISEVVPEPSSLLLLGTFLGLSIMAIRRRLFT